MKSVPLLLCMVMFMGHLYGAGQDQALVQPDNDELVVYQAPVLPQNHKPVVYGSTCEKIRLAVVLGVMVGLGVVCIEQANSHERLLVKAMIDDVDCSNRAQAVLDSPSPSRKERFTHCLWHAMCSQPDRDVTPNNFVSQRQFVASGRCVQQYLSGLK